MNRAFTIAYTPDRDDKEVVKIGCTVKNGKRFKALSNIEREELVEMIQSFKDMLDGFCKDIKKIGHEERP